MSSQELPAALQLKPIISYPREAQVGKTYLVSIDVQLATPNTHWDFPEEEYTIGFILNTSPYFTCEPLHDVWPTIILHRYGGTYGPAEFLLTAADHEIERGQISITLVNGWGIPMTRLELPCEVSLGGIIPEEYLEFPLPSRQEIIEPSPISQGTPAIESPVRTERKPVTIYCSYAYKDEELQRELAEYLAPLQAKGLITYWHDPLVSPADIEDHKKAIDEYLNTAQIILLLISPDFKVSEYQYEFEMKRAMERHEQGDARVIPIMLRPIYWPEPPFGKLQRLPMNGKFITTWEDRGLAFAEVVSGIERVVEELQVLERLPKISKVKEAYTNTKPIEIFVSYALKDQPFLFELEKYLSPLQKQGLIITWSDQDISAGTEWEQEISKHLMLANIILLLVSPDFLLSNYCYGVEMQRAMERHQANEARVIPIIVRPCLWEEAPFANLHVLPTNEQAISLSENRDAAFVNVVDSVLGIIEDPEKTQGLPDIPLSKKVQAPTQPIEIFFIYAHEDAPFFVELTNYLYPLRQQGSITIWPNSTISAGYLDETDMHLEQASLILLLVSPHFLASDVLGHQTQKALQLYQAGKARVIPIIVRACIWEDAIFAYLQALPTGSRPITSWSNQDAALADVANGILRAIEEPEMSQALPGIFSPKKIQTTTPPIEIFFMYAHKDTPFLVDLRNHLYPLSQLGLITMWSDRDIQPGSNWSQEIDQHLMRANIILLLVSPNFLTSNYGYNVEMRRALELHRNGEARVIPIIVQPCEWKRAPFAGLQVLPTNAKPITQWNNQDAAIADVTNGIQRVIEDIKEPQALPKIGDQMESNTLPIEVFLAYAHEDEAYLIKLEKHLSYLSNQGLIKLWSDRQILPDTEWRQEIDMRLKRARIILLLVSSHFLNSNYSSFEMQRALQLHRENEARVIPILVQPCEWTNTPFAHLPVLPTDANPITNWSNQDEAFFDVVRSIRRIVEELKTLLELQQIKQLKRPATVFISYARGDLEEVRDLQFRLNVRGVRCWRDVDDILIGNHTESEIFQAIEHDVDAIALFITPNFLKSEFIWRVEVPAALRRHERDPQFHIVPILLGVTFAEVRQFCYNRNMTDITNFNGLSLGAEQNKTRNEAARRILNAAFTGRLRRINASRNYEPSLFLRTFEFAPPTDNLDLALDWLPLVREKEQGSILQEWDEILWPALLDVKHTISGRIPSHRIHLFVKGLLPIAIALGFVLRESTGMTLLLEGQKETWSTETPSSEKEPLHNEWIYNDNGDQQVAVIEVATSRSTKQGVASTLPRISLTPGYHIRLTSSEFSRESVRDATHARAIARQVGRVCQELCDERGVRHLHLFVAIPVELAVLIGHQLNDLCLVTIYEFKNDERVYTPIGILSS